MKTPNKRSRGERTAPSKSVAPQSTPPNADAIIKDAALRVAQFLENEGPQPGSIISAYLSSIGFRPQEHGFGSLTQFLERIEPKPRTLSFIGTDRVWQLGDFVGPEVRVSELGVAVWRALGSPNSSSVVTVLVNTGNGEWLLKRKHRTENESRVTPSDPQLPLIENGDWRPVPPMPPQEHARVARGFVHRAELGPLQQALKGTLDLEEWWIAWRYLLTGRPDLSQSWFDTRERALRAYIKKALTSKRMRGEVLKRACAAIGPLGPKRVLPEPESEPTPVVAAAPMAQISAGTGSGAEGETASLRSTLQRIIAEMSDEELRHIQIPASVLIRANLLR